MTIEERDGRLLAGHALRKAIENQRAFVAHTWDPRNIRSTGYDLRLAGDRLIRTGLDGKAESYPPGKPFTGDIILQAGDNAFFSTEERVCLNWDISGTLGPKFSLAARGMLVLTGLLVDPGYGWRKDSRRWERNPESRLHFVVANVGPEPISLRRGDAIATIQFYDVAAIPAADRRETQSVGYDVYAEYFEKPGGRTLPGLAFFRNIRDVDQRAKEALSQAETLRQQTEDMLRRVEKVETGSNFVVTFGVYLVSVTILGVVLAMLVGTVTDLPDDLSVPTIIALIVAGIAMAGLTILGSVVAFRSLREAAQPKKAGP